MDHNYLEKNKKRKKRMIDKEKIKNHWLKEDLKRKIIYFTPQDVYIDKPDLKYIGIVSKTPCRFSHTKRYTRRDKRKISLSYLPGDFEFIYPFKINNMMFNNNNYKSHQLNY